MRRLDIRGVIQPFSFLIISKAFKEIREGETLEIMLSGPGAVADLFKILPSSSYATLLMEACRGNDSGIRLRLKKISNPKGGTGLSRAEKSIQPTTKGERNDQSGFKHD